MVLIQYTMSIAHLSLHWDQENMLKMVGFEHSEVI